MEQQETLFLNRDVRFLAPGAVGQLELMTRGVDQEVPSNEDWLVVICHPHPEHGGTMDNKVVTTVARAAREANIASLRFNYRGVGKSEGSYGEFDGECEDFDAIIHWIRQETNRTKILLAGFSFGSAVAATRGPSTEEVKHMLLLAPPVERYPYPERFSMPVTVVQGSADEVVESTEVTQWAEGIQSPFEYILLGHCSHFFHGRLIELRHRLVTLFLSITG